MSHAGQNRRPAGVPELPWRMVVVSWLAIAVFHLLRWIPQWWMYGRVSKWVGHLMRGHLKGSVLDHASRVLGGFPAPEDKELFWEEHVEHLGRSLFEAIALHRADVPEQLDRIELVGGEILDEVRAEGRGGVIFLNHLGSPGAVVATLGIRGYDVAFAGNAINYADASGMYRLDRIEELIQRMFRGVKVERLLLGEDLPAKMSRVLARKGFFATFVDFPVEEKHNVALPFGESLMDVHIGPALLALRRRVPVVSLTALRTGENHHRMVIARVPLPPPDLGLQKAAEELLRSALDQMVNSVRSHPAQWWPWDVVRLSPLSSPS